MSLNDKQIKYLLLILMFGYDFKLQSCKLFHRYIGFRSTTKIIPRQLLILIIFSFKYRIKFLNHFRLIKNLDCVYFQWHNQIPGYNKIFIGYLYRSSFKMDKVYFEIYACLTLR